MQVNDKLAKEKLILEVLREKGYLGSKERVIELIRNTDLTDCQQPMEDCSVTQAQVPPSLNDSGTPLVERLAFIANNTHQVIPEEIEEVCDLAAAALSAPHIPTSEMMHAGYEVYKNSIIQCFECGEIYNAMEAVRTTRGNARESVSDAGSKINPDGPDQGSVRNATDRNAERYLWIRDHTRGGGHINGPQYFESPSPVPLSNIFKGSVAQHFDDAIDAAIRALPDQKD